MYEITRPKPRACIEADGVHVANMKSFTALSRKESLRVINAGFSLKRLLTY